MRVCWLAIALGGCGAASVAGPELDPAITADAPVAPAWQTLRTAAMATVFEITLPNTATATAAAKLAFAQFDDIERRCNEWRSQSELATVSRAAGVSAVAVSPQLMALLTKALAIAAQSEGAFDPTWAALWGTWDFRPAAVPKVPPAAEIARRLKLVGWQRLELDAENGTAYLHDAGMVLGLGGIAKGWALDQAAAVLRKQGVTDALLSAGGQLLALGQGPDGPWQVGLRDPRGGADDVWAKIALRDGESLATSGDYEHFFVVDGHRYHHIIDPRTGWPSRGIRAAATISQAATLADALGKPLLILGAARGLAVLKPWPQAQAVLVDEQGHWQASPQLRERLVVLHEPLAQ